MSEAYLTAEQAKAFLAGHPSVQWIDIFMHDVNGIARGKRIRAGDLMAFADKGFMVPSTNFVKEELSDNDTLIIGAAPFT